MATINIWVDDALKEKSFAVIERFGMLPSQAFKLFLTQIANTGVLPLSLDYPITINHENNPTTMQAINDFRTGKVNCADSLDELMDTICEKN